MNCEPNHTCNALDWPAPTPDPADNVGSITCKRQCPVCGQKWLLTAGLQYDISGGVEITRWRFIHGSSWGDPSRKWRRAVNKRIT